MRRSRFTGRRVGVVFAQAAVVARQCSAPSWPCLLVAAIFSQAASAPFLQAAGFRRIRPPARFSAR